ncbi:MAG: hypothetical protein IAB19_07155 [Proteobacteria bacterium]|uniref:Uncharacterized protein n=1 Tax=Candidatus Avisuccinivibrio stercorigallinarum TaxID=2840704 RepID=A0A9D9GQL3_9GAMM|nr:hypothetical protein [Candidatus Avisuccinivibrio stercorigallinarum]
MPVFLSFAQLCTAALSCGVLLRFSAQLLLYYEIFHFCREAILGQRAAENVKIVTQPAKNSAFACIAPPAILYFAHAVLSAIFHFADKTAVK